MRGLGAAMAVAVLLAMPAGATDAAAVIAVPRARVQTADFRAVGHLVRVDANGTRSSENITIKAHGFPGVVRVLVEIGSPAKARENILLEMRPNGQNVIYIAHPGDTAASILPFEKWSGGPLGSGFSYEDFLEAQYFWPEQSVVPGMKYGARICDVVKSVPGAAERTHYAQIRSWLDHGIGFPVYVEKTLKGTNAVKEFTYLGLRHEGGVWSANQVEEKTRGTAGTTLLIIDRGSARAKLKPGDFSPAQLTRFQD
jgi:hypothetical protein